MMAALGLSGLMALLTVLIHTGGLMGLTAILRHPRVAPTRPGGLAVQGGAILIVVLGLLALHGVEVWAFAGLYLALNEFRDLESALYFSASTFTTLGYGDEVMGRPWRLIAAMEGLIGFMMIGWSTAFLVSVIGRLRALEAELQRMSSDSR